MQDIYVRLAKHLEVCIKYDDLAEFVIRQGACQESV